MALRLSNLRLSIEETESILPVRAAKRLGIASEQIHHWRILRKSLDVRDSQKLKYVYTLEVTLEDEQGILATVNKRKSRSPIRVDSFHEEAFTLPTLGSKPLSHRPIVVGSGPGGLAVAYFLAEQGYQPLVLERGRAVRDRIHDVRAFDQGGPFDPESNYLFGEGGAGTFSDGKLTCRGSGPDVKRILQLFADHKGKPSILYDARPHLGSNRLPAVVKALRQSIERLGGEVRFSCRVEDIDIQDSHIRGVSTSSGYLAAEVVILAIGHSARDTYTMLRNRGVPMEQKPFQMGVRIEHPQETVNRVKYGESLLEQQLGAADYSLVASGNQDLFTFCMCAGGYIMPSVSEPDAFCSNGMSLSKHDSPFANSGLVVTVTPEQFGSSDIFGGIHLQQQFERRAFELGRGEYLCPIQRAEDFLEGRSTKKLPANSYPRGAVIASIAEVVPPFIIDALLEGLPKMDHRWNGRYLPEATLVGPESRGSSPIRIIRDDASRESPSIRGLYPVGEGAGYAGGIVSAAVDGLRTAKMLLSQYAPLNYKSGGSNATGP